MPLVNTKQEQTGKVTGISGITDNLSSYNLQFRSVRKRLPRRKAHHVIMPIKSLSLKASTQWGVHSIRVRAFYKRETVVDRLDFTPQGAR